MCVCVFVCQSDILHWVTTQPGHVSAFGPHQQSAECEPLESLPLNIIALLVVAS